MVVRATDAMLPAPASYSGFASAAVVGRPLALAHAGWSLELAADELDSQVVHDNPVPQNLLGKEEGEDDMTRPLEAAAGRQKTSRYTFPVRIGMKRGFDGLVGVFNCAQRLDTAAHDLGLDLSTIYSDFVDENDEGKATESVVPGQLLLPLRAFYPNVTAAGKSTAAFAALYNRRLTVRGLLLDVFTPMHIYNSILPIYKMALPAWTWQNALSRIRAFFHEGPVLFTQDVPNIFDPSRELTDTSDSV